MWHIIPFQRRKQWNIRWGGESVHGLLDTRGFGGLFTPKNQTSKYKKAQRSADELIEGQPYSIIDRILRRKVD